MMSDVKSWQQIFLGFHDVVVLGAAEVCSLHAAGDTAGAPESAYKNTLKIARHFRRMFPAPSRRN
jgi:hypothetical protein